MPALDVAYVQDNGLAGCTNRAYERPEGSLEREQPRSGKEEYPGYLWNLVTEIAPLEEIVEKWVEKESRFDPKSSGRFHGDQRDAQTGR